MKSTTISNPNTSKATKNKSTGDSITLRKKQKSEALLKQAKKLMDLHPEKTLEVLRNWMRNS